MTPRSCIMRFGGIALIVATVVVAGAFFSEASLVSDSRFAAHDPGVRRSASGRWGRCSGLIESEKPAFAMVWKPLRKWQSVQGGLARYGERASGRASTWTVAPAVTRIRRWAGPAQLSIRRLRWRKKKARPMTSRRLLRKTVRCAKPDSNSIRTERPTEESTRFSRSPGETMRRAVFFSSRISAPRWPVRTWCSAFRRRYSGQG